MTSTFTLNQGSVAVTLNPSGRKNVLSFGDFKFKSVCLAFVITQNYFSLRVEKISEQNIFKKPRKFFNNLAMKKNCALTCTPI